LCHHQSTMTILAISTRIASHVITIIKTIVDRAIMVIDITIMVTDTTIMVTDDSRIDLHNLSASNVRGRINAFGAARERQSKILRRKAESSAG
jgi:hypothetical protein